MGKTIKDIEVVDAEKRRVPSKHYVYIIVVKWSDGSCFKIYRRYSRFFDLQTVLLDSFPIEGGSIEPSKRVIPFLPGKIFFGRSHIKDVAMKRLDEINHYCQSLIALPARISQCEHVLEFFEVEPDDLDPPAPEKNESKKGTTKEKKAEKITKPKRLECFVAVAEYVAQARGELTLQPGMQVEVLEKNDIGWWFVNSEDEQGWVPSTYLEPEEGTDLSQVPKAMPGEEEMFVCIEDFHASSQDEVSLEKGVAVSVIQKNMDGWWLVRYQGKEAFAPGTYLKKASNATRMSMVEKSRLSGVEIVSSLQDVSTLLNADKKPQDQSKPEISLPSKPNKPSFASAIVKQRSLERGGSLKPPPRQNSIKKMEIPSTSPKTAIYMTIADFTDTVGDGISFKEGEKVLVQEKTSTGWWLVKLGEEEGWVPASYLASCTGNLDTPSVYELAQAEGFEDSNCDKSDQDSDEGDWYTEPDDLEEAPASLPPSNRPLPEVPLDNGDYEPVVEVDRVSNRPFSLLPPKDDNKLTAKNTSDGKPSLSSNSNMQKSNPPMVPKFNKMDNNEKKINACGGASDFASVLKAKFESRTGSGDGLQGTQNEDKITKPSKPVVPVLPAKPSDLKKQQQLGEVNKSAKLPIPSKANQNLNTPFPKPPPPVKSKSPVSFDKNPESCASVNKTVLPKISLKPVGSGTGTIVTKNDGKDSKGEKGDVKSMAAVFNKSLTPKPLPSAPSAVATKTSLPPKPQLPGKPKPSVPSKPSVGAKPKPSIQFKGSQNVSNIANVLNNKLTPMKPSLADDSENSVNNNNNQKSAMSSLSLNVSAVSPPPKPVQKPKAKNFVTVYDFVGEGDGEISFREGDYVTILEENGDWVFIQLEDEQGWAPSSYIEEQ